MNLRSIDLNLLVILDALLDEAHVSRAADRVGLTQPAASAALDRCRRLFRDRLLERSGRGTMRLGARRRRKRWRPPLKDLPAQDGGAGRSACPAARRDRRTVRLSMADQPAALVLAPLLRALRETAPGEIDLALTPWRGGAAEAGGAGRRGERSAVTLPAPEGDGLRQRRLLSESYVAAMRARPSGGAGVRPGELARPSARAGLWPDRRRSGGPARPARRRAGRARAVATDRAERSRASCWRSRRWRAPT